MKALIIAVVLGALGYFIFFYNPDDSEPGYVSQDESAEIREEYDIQSKTYSGAITETYNKYKAGINDAKDAVFKIEERDRQTY